MWGMGSLLPFTVTISVCSRSVVVLLIVTRGLTLHMTIQHIC